MKKFRSIAPKKGLYLSSEHTASGLQSSAREYNSTVSLHTEVVEENAKLRKRKADMIESAEIQAARKLDVAEAETINSEDILDGTASIDISHIGGEFLQILLDDDTLVNRSPRMDHRTRRDRVQRRNEGFDRQMNVMTDSYLSWKAGLANNSLHNADPFVALETDTESTIQADGLYLEIIDVFRSYKCNTRIVDSSEGIAASLIKCGLIPCAPFTPSLAIATRTLELYRTTHLRCPHLGIQPFVKSLCDLHGNPFKPYFSQQFSICYDLYLRLRNEAKKRLDTALGRDKNDWRLRNACSACTYKLENETPLEFSMLFAMDGNDSAKRVLPQVYSMEQQLETDINPTSVSNDLPDSRTIPNDYYISRDIVNSWDRSSNTVHSTGSDVENGGGTSKEKNTKDTIENPCESRWNNMSYRATARAWSIFDETGIFVSLCRHGFVLKIVDMVRSGELSKYPLSILASLLETFGERLGGGYDIGCQFETTLRNSPLGQRAHELGYRSLVGSFHGHAHNRRCQLSNLATYVSGLGLEDLEGCERFFSKSNALASQIRHSTPFHRQQSLVEYIKHLDAFETSHSLSSFLVNNYKQALEIISGEEELKKEMARNNISGTEVFSKWLDDERNYLLALSKEPIQETLEMEYYQKLVNLQASEEKLQNIRNTWEVNAITQQDENSKTNGMKTRKQSSETKLRHALENVEKNIEAVQDLEKRLGITERWDPRKEEWKNAALMVSRRRYQRCLDNLESLVVSRIFELTKLNMSQTGYKLRKHIAKALQQRSSAIKSALDQYNAAAKAMNPSRQQLSWDQVVNYAFLADFDLLRDTREDVTERLWARPSSRLMMDQYFKIQRAWEEILRLNIEIRRMVTHLQDEDIFLTHKEMEYKAEDPVLSHLIRCYRQERLRFAEVHLKRFYKLSSLPGFTGDLSPGECVDRTLRSFVIADTDNADKPDIAASIIRDDNGDILDEAEQEEEENQNYEDKVDVVLAVSY